MKTCTSCDRQHDRPAELCFGCHVKGIGFGFVGGGGYGRKNFHERTNAQAIREATLGKKKDEVVYAGSSWYSGPAA